MTTDITIYRAGDVVLVPFPFTNFTAVKQRPALVISGRDFNRTQDIILLAITSNPVAERQKYTQPLNKIECQKAGLFFPSFIKFGKIITLDQRLIRKRLGRLPLKTIKESIALMTTIFE